ncbi:MAG TPA: type IV toxin-antitoxin system AbiEi family antitoxin domain-containing protein [Ilumatobacteraceae bacterium]|nr:type IV toxin-antitoxin system AbiEi family antitoxin domain-containing protein [Ilumatobacteraceae bacterium]
MARWQSEFDEWMRVHHGVAGARELQQLGMSARTIERMTARGRLIRILPGVFRSPQWSDTRESVMRAACARNEAALIGFTTAAKLWGLRGVQDLRVHVLVPHGASPELDGIVVHRCRRIDDVDRVIRPDGIRLTSPPRTLFDSADMLGLTVARSATEQLLQEKKCTFGTIFDTYRRLAAPRRPGTTTMRDVLASRPAWRAALQSHLEQLVLEELERQGVPAHVPQCPIELESGAVIHVDFGWPRWRIGLEVDDPAWHDGVEERHRDMRRDRKAAIVGWHVVRVSRIDVDGPLREAVADVAALIRSRRRVA